jgi:hypothetical protein
VCGFGYELLVLGLWLIIARAKDSVEVGNVAVVWFRQGRKKITILKKR